MTAIDTRLDVRSNLAASIKFWALAGLVLYVVSGVAFAGFSYVDGGWAAASDATAVLLAVALLMLVLRLDSIFFEGRGADLARVAKWFGVSGTAIAIGGGVLLVLGQTVFEALPLGPGLTLQFIGWGLLGVWFILIAHLGVESGVFSRGWAWAARVAGVGQILAMAATIPFGTDSVLASIGYAMTFFAVISWSLLTRKEVAV